MRRRTPFEVYFTLEVAYGEAGVGDYLCLAGLERCLRGGVYGVNAVGEFTCVERISWHWYRFWRLGQQGFYEEGWWGGQEVISHSFYISSWVGSSVLWLSQLGV